MKRDFRYLFLAIEIAAVMIVLGVIHAPDHRTSVHAIVTAIFMGIFMAAGAERRERLQKEGKGSQHPGVTLAAGVVLMFAAGVQLTDAPRPTGASAMGYLGLLAIGVWVASYGVKGLWHRRAQRIAGDPFESEAGLLLALGELKSLSILPEPQLDRWPPWEKIRAALPPDCELPTAPVNVLVDLEIDGTGLVTRAAVGHPPLGRRNELVLAVCVGPDGKEVVEPPVPEGSAEIAEAVAAAHVGERFSPGERDGLPVAVRLLRVGVGISPGTLGGTRG